MSAQLDYWEECISIAAEEVGLVITPDQLKAIASAVESSHDNYGLAFYSPPASDHYDHLEREQQRKFKNLEKELEDYRNNAETAIKQALRQRPDANVSIGEYGEVTRYDGRTTRIQ